MDNPSDYQIVSTVRKQEWNTQLQEARDGWEVKALDGVTGTVVTVFYPNVTPDAAAIGAMIEEALGPVREVHQLGKQPS